MSTTILDGLEIGQLGNGEEKQFNISAGQHQLMIKIDWGRSNIVSFAASDGSNDASGDRSRIAVHGSRIRDTCRQRGQRRTARDPRCNAAAPWSDAQIDAAMHDTKSQRVELRVPIRVMILYGTAMATEAGPVQFFEDIYGHDRKLEEMLALRPVDDRAAASR